MKPGVRQAVDRSVACPPRQLTGACAAMLDDRLRRLRGLPGHGNRLLHYDQLLTAHLPAFFDPAVRSLRTLDARGVSAPTMRQSLGGPRLCRSTLGQAMAQMPADALLPWLKELLTRLPAGCSPPESPDLQDLLTLKKRILAVDGSHFCVPADVPTALAHRRSNGKIGRQVRLDPHLDVPRFLPVKAQADGASRGSESAALSTQLEAGVVYLAGRNFVGFDVLSVVESMSYFIGDDGKEYDIFGRGGAEIMAQQMGVPFLGAVPIHMSLRQASDAGTPLANFKQGAQLAAELDAVVRALAGQIRVHAMSEKYQQPTISVS